MNWHTRQERRVIKKHGGTPLIKYGYDGLIRNRPVEVRAVQKDNRFRIQKNVHKNLVRQNGSYIFCDKKSSKRVSAKQVSELIGRGRWYKDRNYPHKFLKTKEVL